MQDINEQIFVPLRDEMRKEALVAPEAAKPAVPQQQQPAKPLVPATLQGAAATPPRPLLVGAKPPQILIPAAPISPRPALRDVLSAVMKAPSAPQKVTPPSPPKPITPATPPTPPKPTTSYSIDPYREPLDEK